MLKIKVGGGEDLHNVALLMVENWRSAYKDLLDQNFLDRLDVEQTEEHWRFFIAREGCGILIACLDGRFAGFAAYQPDHDIERCLYLDSLHVARFLQGQGIGTELIVHVGRYAFDQGYKKLSLTIVKGNEGAKRLYEKLGAEYRQEISHDFGGITATVEKLVWETLKNFAQR